MKQNAIFIFLLFTIRKKTVTTSEITTKQSSTDGSQEVSCHTPLSKSDSDIDGKLSDNEYAQYISLISGDSTPGLFGDLPYELQITFMYLDCICDKDTSKIMNCCDGT